MIWSFIIRNLLKLIINIIYFILTACFSHLDQRDKNKLIIIKHFAISVIPPLLFAIMITINLSNILLFFNLHYFILLKYNWAFKLSIMLLIFTLFSPGSHELYDVAFNKKFSSLHHVISFIKLLFFMFVYYMFLYFSATILIYPYLSIVITMSFITLILLKFYLVWPLIVIDVLFIENDYKISTFKETTIEIKSIWLSITNWIEHLFSEDTMKSLIPQQSGPQLDENIQNKDVIQQPQLYKEHNYTTKVIITKYILDNFDTIIKKEDSLLTIIKLFDKLFDKLRRQQFCYYIGWAIVTLMMFIMHSIFKAATKQISWYKNNPNYYLVTCLFHSNNCLPKLLKPYYKIFFKNPQSRIE